MKPAKNFKELEKQLNEVLRDVMTKEVAEKVKDVQQEELENEVYSSYQPYEYERRRDNGGLQDRDNMIATITNYGGGLQLSVKNITKGDQDDYEIAGLIEYGHEGGHGDYSYPFNRDNTAWKFLRPRPFIEESRKTLMKHGEHIDAMEKGLNKRGIKTL